MNSRIPNRSSIQRGENEPLLNNTNRAAHTPLPMTTDNVPLAARGVRVCKIPTVLKIDEVYQQIPPSLYCSDQHIELGRNDNDTDDDDGGGGGGDEREIAVNRMTERAGKPWLVKHRQPWAHQDEIKCILLSDNNQRWYLFYCSSKLSPSTIEYAVRSWNNNKDFMMLHLAILGFVYYYQNILTNFYNFCNENPVFFSTHEIKIQVALRATLDLMRVKCKNLPERYIQENHLDDYLYRLAIALTEFEAKRMGNAPCNEERLQKYFRRIEEAFFARTHSITNDNYQMQMHRVIAKNLRPNLFLLFINYIRAIWKPCDSESALYNCAIGTLLIPFALLFWFAYVACSYIVPIAFVVLVYVFDRNDLGINPIHIWLSFVHALFLLILDPIRLATKRKSYKEFKSFNAAIEEAQLEVLNNQSDQIYTMQQQQTTETLDGHSTDGLRLNIDDVEHRNVTPHIQLKSEKTESFNIMGFFIILITSIAFPIGQLILVTYGDGTRENNTEYIDSNNHSINGSSNQLFTLFTISFIVNYMAYFILISISVYLYWTQSKILEKYFVKISQYDFTTGITRNRFDIANPLAVQHVLLTMKCHIRSIKSNPFAATVTACVMISIVGMSAAAFIIYVVSHQITERSILISLVYIGPVSILGLGIIVKVLSINEIITLGLPQLFQAKKHQITNQILAKQLLSTDEDEHIKTLIYWRDYLDHNINHMASRRDDDVIKILGVLEVNKRLLAGIITSALTSAISLLLSYGKSG